MRLRFLIGLILAGTCVPAAFAAQSDVWDMHSPPVQITANSLTHADVVANGIHVATNTDGILYWSGPLPHGVDVLTVRLVAPKAVNIAFVWHPPGTEPGVTTELDVHVDAKPDAQSIDIVPAENGYWSPKADIMGIGIPGGSDITIESLTWTRLSLTEKIGEAWKSFWTFDGFRPYSINFLWGPLFTFNDVSRAKLFDHLPPFGLSANRLFYLIIALSVLIGAALFFASRDRRKGMRTALRLVVATIAVVWLVFDMRMGTEILSYAVSDVQSYVLPPFSQKTFRTHDNFYSVAQQMLPMIEQYDRYVIVQYDQQPFYTNLRYMSYPSIAMQPTDNTIGVKLWVVIERPDVHLDAEGRLVDASGKAFTPPGHIIETIEKGTFLFAT